MGKRWCETASDEMVMGAVQALCGFSLLVSKPNHSDLSLTRLDDTLKRFYLKEELFREQKMSKSVKAKVDDLFATESHQLCEQKIRNICAAMEALVYWAEKVSWTKLRQFQVRLNSARHAAPTWLDADRQKAIERFKRVIHQVTPAEWQLFD